MQPLGSVYVDPDPVPEGTGADVDGDGTAEAAPGGATPFDGEVIVTGEQTI